MPRFTEQVREGDEATVSHKGTAKRSRSVERSSARCVILAYRSPMKIYRKIENPPRRKHMAFLGGAVLADIIKGREEFWDSKQEWDEYGAQALDKLGRGEN